MDIKKKAKILGMPVNLLRWQLDQEETNPWGAKKVNGEWEFPDIPISTEPFPKTAAPLTDREFYTHLQNRNWEKAVVVDRLGSVLLYQNSSSMELGLKVGNRIWLNTTLDQWQDFFVAIARKEINKSPEFNHIYAPFDPPRIVERVVKELNSLAKNNKLRKLSQDHPILTFLRDNYARYSTTSSYLEDGYCPWDVVNDVLGVAPFLLRRIWCEPIFRLMGKEAKWMATNISIYGPQGCGKSSLGSAVWPKEYCGSIANSFHASNTFDIYTHLEGKAVVELAEATVFQGMGEEAKEFLSRTQIKTRKPRTAQELSYKRINSFFITTNTKRHIPDCVEGRRIVVLELAPDAQTMFDWLDKNALPLLAEAYKLVKRSIDDGTVDSFIPDFLGEAGTKQSNLFYETQMQYRQTIKISEGATHLQFVIKDLLESVADGKYVAKPWSTKAFNKLLKGAGINVTTRQIPQALSALGWGHADKVQCQGKRYATYFPPNCEEKKSVKFIVLPEHLTNDANNNSNNKLNVKVDISGGEVMFEQIDWSWIKKHLDIAGIPGPAGSGTYPRFKTLVWGACAACHESDEGTVALKQKLIDYIKSNWGSCERIGDFLKLVLKYNPNFTNSDNQKITSASLKRAANNTMQYDAVSEPASISYVKAPSKPLPPDDPSHHELKLRALSSLPKATEQEILDLIPDIAGLEAPHYKKLKKKPGDYWAINYLPPHTFVNSTGADKDTLYAASHFVFFEIDNCSLADQVIKIRELNKKIPCCFSVYSGNKSLHTYIKLSEPCYDWGKWKAAQILLNKSLKSDSLIKHAGRLMRRPSESQPAYLWNEGKKTISMEQLLDLLSK